MPWQFLKNAVTATMSGGVRGALDQIRGAFGLPGGSASAQSSAAFTMAVVALAAKMSKADGISTEVEARAFEQQFSVPDDQCATVNRLFELAAQDVAGFEAYAAQIARMLHDDRDLKVSVLECLFLIAVADDVLHPEEDEYLARVAEIFGFTTAEFKCLRRGFVSDPDSPYDVLDVSPRASDAEIKARYRDLVKSHHPDVLVAKGVPAEMLSAAGHRLAVITSAYEAIQKERGLLAERALETGR